MAPGEQFRALLLTDIDVAEDFFKLLGRNLRTDHGGGFERVGLLDGCDALESPFHEAVVDALLNKRAAGAGADFALVEREHDEAFDGFIEEVVVFAANIFEEN